MIVLLNKQEYSMKYIYASSYISGFKKTVEKILKTQVLDAVIVEHLDGLIIFKTELEFSKLKLGCFNNIYQVLAMSKTDSKISYETALKKFVNHGKINAAGIANNVKLLPSKSFKILPFDSNSPISINFDVIKKIEQQIQHELGIKVEFKKHDFDIVLSRRREGIFLLLFKLTYNRLTEKDLPKGALRPELCNILSAVADIKPNDIILDSFCGHGSIPKEIVKHFKYNMLFAGDIDANLIEKLKTEFKKNKKNLFIKQRDALHLDYFENGFFDKIITDPPWNLYNSKDEDFSGFYKSMLKEFHRILKSGGTCVILMGNIVDFEKALDSNEFKTVEKYHILVNGKKANVYKLIKI